MKKIEMEIKISRDKLILAAGQSIKEKNYWLNKLAGELVKTHFPYDYREKRPGKKNAEPMKSLHFTFPAPLYEKVMKLSGGNDVKLHMILVTGMFILLHKYTGNNDIMIGSPIFKQEIEGEFVNTVLVFRNETAAHLNFKELLLEVRNTIIEADENQNYPLEILLEELNMPVMGDELPIFDVVLLLENLQSRNYLNGVEYNMLFSFSRTVEGIDGVAEYNPQMYREETTRRIVNHYLILLDQALSDINLPLFKVEILSDQEKQQLLFDFNNTEIDYPGGKLLHQLFEEQAERTPGNIALIGESLELNVFMPLTYGELNTRSNQLANILREKGVEADTIVALMMEPSIEMMISILGILKSGGAYLPIDIDYPKERIDYMLRDSGTKILLGTEDDQKEIIVNCQLLIINCELKTSCSIQAPFHHSSFIVHHSSHLAYIIYTSGTTGKPKGVMVEHRNVVAYMHAFLHYFHIDATDTVIQLASYCFDVFVEEVFPVLSKGGRLVIPGRKEVVEMEGLSRLISEYHVTMIDCTPLLLNEFDRLHADTGGAALESVRTFISGGDVLKQGYVEHLLKTGRIYNTYGPTESTVCAAYYHYTGYSGIGDVNSIPIGKPIANYKIYILDEHRNPVPLGVAGELCVAGPGVARGYLNRLELTADKFKKYRSYRTDRTNIIYRTGDLGRWLPDGPPAGGAAKGIIEYLGRIDQQVKVRGFRIELGEIEAQLEKHELVDKAAVIDREEGSGEKYLSAYIVAREPFDLSILRNYLSQVLPDYMIPAYFTPVGQIPVTPNGKVDRKALPEPKIAANKAYIPPGDEIEEKLVEIWADILNLAKEAISVESDFFELGGHSLKATVLVSKIHKELHIKLPVLEVFRNQTVRKLSQYINQNRHVENRFSGIEPAEKKEYYVLSSVQRRLYFIFQLEENSTVYNMPDIIPLKGEVDKERLEQIFEYLIQRHESFRTSFHLINQEPVQRVHEEFEFKMEILGVRDQGAMISGFIRPFDLSQAPLLRAGLVRTREEKYFLLVDIHHIIMDAVSMDFLKREFEKLYTGAPGPLQALNLQYKDYAEWRQREMERGALKAQEKFWLGSLAGELPVLRLPMDFPRPLAQSFEGNTKDFPIDEKKEQRLRELVFQSGSTLYITLLAVFNLLLFKLSGQEDIIVGTIVASRRHADLENIIGMFVNTLPMRNFPNAEKSFREFLEEVKQSTMAVFENQDYPFEELVDKVAVNRDIGRNPIFDVVFSLQNLPEQWKVTEHTSYGYESKISKFDITLSALETGGNLAFSLEYCTRLFEEETIERFIGYFINIIYSIIENPSQRISNVEILSEVEKRQLLIDFNGANEQYPGDKTIPQLFQAQVEKTPDHIAVVGSSLFLPVQPVSPVRPIRLTYRQLDEQSGRLAGLLVEKGILADSIVGIMTERSIEMIIGILGILKSGGAYLPIDPSAPRERVDYMLKDSAAKIMIGRAEFVFSSFFPASPLLRFVASDSANLAYIIYTSGSTGRPKGVMVEQRNVANLVFGLKERIYSKFNRNLEVALVAPYIFDASVKQIFGALLLGYSLYIAPEEARFDGEELFEFYMKNAIDISDGTPTHLRLLLECRGGKNLKLPINHFLIGGEPLAWKIVEKLFDHFEIHSLKITNVYGPTECCVDNTTYEISKENLGIYSSVPIGAPMPNQQAYIVDSVGNLQPIGVPGQLCIGGNSVSRGYLNNPELTEEKFMKSFSGSAYRRGRFYKKAPLLYKTGDLARWLESGDIEFLGRIDHQVKIRGFRIELGEIEAELLKHELVKEVVVIDRESETSEKYLCCYIVPREEFDFSRLKEYLSRCLPDYMIPSYFTAVERIPLTINGKVDLGALPEPTIIQGEKYDAPGNEIEEKIVDIWSEVLGIEKSKISTNANFFDIGGHSLKAMIIIAKIHKAFNIKLQLIQVFRVPTIRGIASLIEALRLVSDQEPESGINEEHEREETFI